MTWEHIQLVRVRHLLLLHSGRTGPSLAPELITLEFSCYWRRAPASSPRSSDGLTAS